MRVVEESGQLLLSVVGPVQGVPERAARAVPRLSRYWVPQVFEARQGTAVASACMIWELVGEPFPIRVRMLERIWEVVAPPWLAAVAVVTPLTEVPVSALPDAR
jgi:hypothetical protein